MNTIQDGHLEVNGVRLHYLRAGSGPRAIVLTHGNSHCGGVWVPLVAGLAGNEFTAIAWDLPGHGWSDAPEQGYDWASLRDDLVGLVTALELRDVVFAGHSRGGGVSLIAAAALGDRCRAALVYEPTMPVQAGADGQPAPVPEPPRMAEMAARALRRRESFPSREALAAHYRSQDAFKDWRDDYFEAFLTYGVQVREDGSAGPCVPPRAVARLFEATFGFDAWRNVSAPDLPVTAVYGDRSGRLGGGRDPLAALRTMFPRVERRVMQDATHTGPMEHPETFERLLREAAG
ncbi:MAG TPA: alpha/beta hydrolase [Dehalococcoidia bacterium]|nr:alpha/beta hydrolase [Dehalococcoidia bacterium]